MNFIVNLVQAINAINSNVWMVIILCLGVFLCIHAPALAAGASLITGAFAIIQSSNKKDSQ